MIFQNFYGMYTLTKREVSRFMKVYIQTILAPILSNLLFLGIFGAALQKREVSFEGLSYLNFLVPGLCAMGAIMSAVQNPSSSLIIQKFQNLIHDLNSYPLNTSEKVMAYMLGGAFRGTLVGFLTYLACIPFVGAEIKMPILFFIALFLISAVFSLLGIIIGLSCENFDRLSFIISIILTPLIYFGGVFFEISNLPGILSKIAAYNPIFPLVDLLRWSFLGISEAQLSHNLVFLLINLLVIYLITWQLFNRGVGLKD